MDIKIPKHLKKRFKAISKLPVSLELPQPWGKPTWIAVGGLTDVGFADSSDLLLCVSADGRGLIDCLSGEKISRDYDRDFNFDAGNLLIEGIGPLADQTIRMAGLAGGGLASGAYDGWSIELYPLAFPDSQLIVSPPRQTMLWTHREDEMQLHKLGGFVTGLKTFGFSPTGNSLVIAISSDVIIYVRD